MKRPIKDYDSYLQEAYEKQTELVEVKLKSKSRSDERQGKKG